MPTKAATNWFGNNTLGPSYVTIENSIKGSVFAVPRTGDANNITVGLRYSTTQSTWNIKCGIYKHDDLSFVAETEERSIMPTANLEWYTFDLVTEPSLVAGTDYVLVAWSNNMPGLCQMGYESGATNQGHWCTATYGTFPDPLVPNHINSNYSIYCIYTPVPSPAYSNVTSSDFQAGMPCIFNATWTANSGNMSYCKFESNNTGTMMNTTYAFPSALSTAYSNVTVTLNSTAYQQIQWRFWANNTDGGYNQTEWQHITTFPKTPPMQHDELGYSATDSRGSLYIANGAISAIFYVWLNSSTSKYECAAYNIRKQTRSSTHFIANAASPEAHWEPSIGEFPNGSIGVFFGHGTPIKYYYTIKSADNETDLDDLLDGWSSEKTVPLGSDDSCSLPDVISFEDVLVLWCRGGTGGMDFNRWLMLNYTTTWNTKRVVMDAGASGSSYQYYLEYPLKYNETMILWSGWSWTSALGYHNVLFFYSNNQGNTFRKYNGNVLTLPFIDNDTAILTTNGYHAASGCRPCLNEEKRIFQPYISTAASNGTFKMLLGYYNATIGTTSGAWTFGKYISDEDGNVIRANGIFTIHYDSYYRKPTIWNSPLNVSSLDKNNQYWAGYPTKWVQDPWNYSRFHKVFEWTNYTVDITPQANLQIQGMPRAFEFYGRSVRDNIIGKQTKGANERWLTYVNYAWASKFQPTVATAIDCVWVRIRWAGATNGLHGKAALYQDGTPNDILVSGGVDVDIVSGATSQGADGWSRIPIGNYVLLNTSKTYWLVFQINLAGGGDTYVYNSTSTITNQTFRVTRTYANSWENQLTPKIYFNYTLSIFGVQDILVVSGLGVTPVYIHANQWTNLTATPYDIEHSLEQICANLQYEGIDAWIIRKDNGTVYQYNYGHTSNASIKILLIDDIIQVYSLSSGFWDYSYLHFKYLSIVSLATTQALNLLIKSQMRILSSFAQDLNWGLLLKSDYLLTLATSYVPKWFFTIRVLLGPVGGIVIPTEELTLLAPYLGLASTILVTTIATLIYVKRVRHRKGSDDHHSDQRETSGN